MAEHPNSSGYGVILAEDEKRRRVALEAASRVATGQQTNGSWVINLAYEFEQYLKGDRDAD